MTKYINVKNLKTGQVSIQEWLNYSFENNPYKLLKKGWKILSIHNTFGQAMVKGVINQNL